MPQNVLNKICNIIPHLNSSPITSNSFDSSDVSSHQKRHSNYDYHSNYNQVDVYHHTESPAIHDFGEKICQEEDAMIPVRIELEDKHHSKFGGEWVTVYKKECYVPSSAMYPLIVAVLFGVSAVAYLATRFGWERLKRAMDIDVKMPLAMDPKRAAGAENGNGGKPGGPLGNLDMSQPDKIIMCGAEQEEHLLHGEQSLSSMHSSGDEEGRSHCDLEAAMDAHEADDEDRCNNGHHGDTLSAEVEKV